MSDRPDPVDFRIALSEVIREDTGRTRPTEYSLRFGCQLLDLLNRGLRPERLLMLLQCAQRAEANYQARSRRRFHQYAEFLSREVEGSPLEDNEAQLDAAWHTLLALRAITDIDFPRVLDWGIRAAEEELVPA
ncbi:hypothetical protein ACFTXJ_14540 [Streptomyces zhihengii]|uniref:hypothetical protein n=1 Tax=Streptomyces zhihengii TaxID=1818004 RepID=UPI00363816FA